jgi:hypothetical protein
MYEDEAAVTFSFGSTRCLALPDEVQDNPLTGRRPKFRTTSTRLSGHRRTSSESFLHRKSESGMGGEAVLIVEDNALSAKLAKILFVAEGYEVRIASRAGQALALLRERRPDIVLTDLRLPDMDGFAPIPPSGASSSWPRAPLATWTKRSSSEPGATGSSTSRSMSSEFER